MVVYYREPELPVETDISVIFQKITERVSSELERNVNFQFGDWAYISNQLQIASSSKEAARERYPVICLFSPADEDKRIVGGKTTIYLDFLIAVSSDAKYSNEKRREVSFEKVLRPIYDQFIKEIIKDHNLDMGYRPMVSHAYTENYRYGRLGVNGPDNKPFNDKIDAIDIKKLEITIKKKING